MPIDFPCADLSHLSWTNLLKMSCVSSLKIVKVQWRSQKQLITIFRLYHANRHGKTFLHLTHQSTLTAFFPWVPSIHFGQIQDVLQIWLDSRMIPFLLESESKSKLEWNQYVSSISSCTKYCLWKHAKCKGTWIWLMIRLWRASLTHLCRGRKIQTSPILRILGRDMIFFHLVIRWVYDQKIITICLVVFSWA